MQAWTAFSDLAGLMLTSSLSLTQLGVCLDTKTPLHLFPFFSFFKSLINFLSRGTRELFNGYKEEKTSRETDQSVSNTSQVQSSESQAFMWGLKQLRRWSTILQAAFVFFFFFKWLLQLSLHVNGLRSHRIVMNRLIISEMLDWMTGALEELWFAAHLWHLIRAT